MIVNVNSTPLNNFVAKVWLWHAYILLGINHSSEL